MEHVDLHVDESVRRNPKKAPDPIFSILTPYSPSYSLTPYSLEN